MNARTKGGGPDITGGDTVEQAYQSGLRAGAGIARQELCQLLNGNMARKLSEVLEHVAFIEQHLPAGDKMRIRTAFGDLLDPEMPLADPAAAAAHDQDTPEL